MNKKTYPNEIYQINADNSARYILGKYEKNPLVFFGINPSTASAEKNDNTISIIENVARKFGYDGYIMLNIYPVRATKINNNFLNSYDEREMRENLKYVKNIVMCNKDVVASWGTNITDTNYFIKSLVEINKIVDKAGAKWLCLARTKYGHPHHPTRIAYDKMELNLFDMNSYIKSLQK